jgi:phosphoglycerate dehydrogenase-like enzyme
MFTRMKLLILLHHRFELWNAPAWFVEKLRDDFPQLDIVHLSTYEKVENHLRDAEIAITWSLRPEQFAVARELRWIHSPAAAVHQLMFPELVNSGVLVTNAREVHAPVVAEHVMALLFALAKKIPQAVRLQQMHLWGKNVLKPLELDGATLGLVGLGSIGREVTKRASALGMRVIAVRNNPGKQPAAGVQKVFAASELDAMIGEADYVVIAAPRTRETEKLFDAQRIAKLKPGACLINVSRGALVDEVALAAALRNKTLAAAALDVFVEEPLPSDSPLWDLENLLITPHTAAVTDKLWQRHYALVYENLRRFLAGQPLLGLVDKQKGY